VQWQPLAVARALVMETAMGGLEHNQRENSAPLWWTFFARQLLWTVCVSRACFTLLKRDVWLLWPLSTTRLTTPTPPLSAAALLAAR
jgi:hypothetical protein